MLVIDRASSHLIYPCYSAVVTLLRCDTQFLSLDIVISRAAVKTAGSTQIGFCGAGDLLWGHQCENRERRKEHEPAIRFTS